MSLGALHPPASPAKPRRSRYVIVSAWAVPALILGEFAMLAIVPVALLVAGTFRNARLRALRWWAVAVAALYGGALVAWALDPDRAPSLSKELNPLFAAVIMAASVAFAIRYHMLSRAARER